MLWTINMHVYSIRRDIISQGNWKIVGPLYVCVCVCWQLKRSQRHLSIDRPVAVPVPSAPLRLWLQKVAAQHKWCLSARALSSPCALWLSMRLCESLHQVSIGSLSRLFRVSFGSQLCLRVLSVDLLPLMLPKVPPWLVTEMRQMTNDLKFITAARSLCSQTQTEMHEDVYPVND